MTVKIPDFTTKHGVVLAAVVVGFIILIYGVFELGWYINEIAAIFLAMGVISGLLVD